MQIIDYTCKFCGYKGAVEFDDSQGIPYQLEKWKAMLCCNRCADYMVDKRKLTNGIAKAAVLLERARMAKKGEDLFKVEAEIREMLVELTKKLTTAVCNYYNKTNVWDVEFVNMLMDKPASFWTAVSMYVKGIRTI